VSIVNHYNFRTYCLDLGLFNNAIYDYAHFQWNNCSLLLPNFQINNTLGDHFSLLPVFISPFYWLFGSYTMLIFQIMGILWGGVGIYKLIFKISTNKAFSLLAVVHFFSIWAIYSALGFDYHDNVLAAMFVPWFLYFVHIEKWWYAAICFFLILVSKENMALWMSFICFGLIVMYYKDWKKLKYLIPGAIISGLFFILLIKLIIPSISSPGNGYIHFDFSALGKDMYDVIISIIKYPKHAFSLLFENHLGDPLYNGIKTELFFVVILSGGFALLFKPQYLIMLFPVFLQKLYNDDFAKWGINYHYSIELVPIITIALFLWIADKSYKWKNLLAAFFILITMYTTKSVLDNRKSLWYSPVSEQFYSRQHYSRNFDVKEVYSALNHIPENAKLSAQNSLVPHVCFRDEIYHYPFIGNAEYIALLTADENIYPFQTKEEYNKNIENLKQSGNWIIYFQNTTTLILKRIQR